MDEDDVVQEVRIKLWQLLENKFDPEAGNVNSFVVGHINLVVLGVISGISRSLSFTGKNSTRSQFREIQKRSISLDSWDSLARVYINNYDQSYKDDDFNTVDKIDHLLYHLTNMYDNTDFLTEYDFDVLLKEIYRVLGEDLFRTFELVYIKDFTQTETAEILNLNTSTVNKRLKKIKSKVFFVLKDLDII